MPLLFTLGSWQSLNKEIDDESDDKAHIDEEAQEQIEIIHSSPKEFDFLVGQTIKPDEGVTHKLYKEGDDNEGEGDDPPEEGEGEETKEPKSDDPKHIFIQEVVREPKIKYFKVPRLGSYLSIKLSYQSCQSEEAIEAAIADKVE
jgi:hypothetical protein